MYNSLGSYFCGGARFAEKIGKLSYTKKAQNGDKGYNYAKGDVKRFKVIGFSHGDFFFFVSEIAYGDMHDKTQIALQSGGVGAPDLVLHGHTHRYRWERVGRAWVFNPGECAGMLRGHNVVGILDLRTLSIEQPRF